MRIGLSLPAKTFMPEQTDTLDENYNAYKNLLYGYKIACDAGYDYIEAAVGAVNELTEDELLKLSELTKSGNFYLEICNCFIPSDLPIFDTPFESLESFVEESMKRMSMLRVKKVVFGSGAARKRPENVSEEDGIERIFDFLRMCGRIGKKYGITTVVEQLNSTETNIINSVCEGAAIVRKVGLPNILLLADVFHMAMENESVEVVSQNSDIISHFHVSEAPGRVFPGKYSGEYIKRFGNMLKANEIDRDITVECVFENFEEEAEKSLKFLKEEVL